MNRWTTPDPAGLAAVDPTNPQSWNQYTYVLNNPMAYTDALGLYDPGCDPGDPTCCDPTDPWSGACGPCVIIGGIICPPLGPIGGGGGGGGGEGGVGGGQSGPPINVGVPDDDTGMGTGPIWTEKIPISSGPLSPYLIIQNWIGRDANGNWLGIPCPYPKVGDWIDENWCAEALRSIVDDRVHNLAQALQKKSVYSLDNPCTVGTWFLLSASGGVVVSGPVWAPEAVETASQEYPSLIHQFLTWLTGMSPVATGRVSGTIAVIKAAPGKIQAACSEIQ